MNETIFNAFVNSINDERFINAFVARLIDEHINAIDDDLLRRIAIDVRHDFIANNNANYAITNVECDDEIDNFICTIYDVNNEFDVFVIDANEIHFTMND